MPRSWDRTQAADYIRYARGVIVDMGAIAASELGDIDRWLKAQGLGPDVQALPAE